MSVKKGKDSEGRAGWFVVKADGTMGKRRFLTKETAEASQAAGRHLGGGSAPSANTPARSAAMADTVGTRSKTKSTLGAKVAMEMVLVPRASDLGSLLEGFINGLQPGAAVPDFTGNANQDSDDVQIGRAMGDAIGAYMASKGMTQADWERLMPKVLPEGPGILDGLGLGGGAIEAVAGAATGILAPVLSGLTGNLIGGDGAAVDVLPGKQGGSVVSLF